VDTSEFWLEKQKHLLEFMSFIEGIRWKFVGTFSVSAVIASVFNIYFRISLNSENYKISIDPIYILYLICAVCLIAIAVQIRIYGLFKNSWDSYGEIDNLLSESFPLLKPNTSIPACYHSSNLWAKFLSVHMLICSLFAFIIFLNFHIVANSGEIFSIWHEFKIVLLSVAGAYVAIFAASEWYSKLFKPPSSVS